MINKINLSKVNGEIQKMLNAKSSIRRNFVYLIFNHSEYLSFANGFSSKISQIEKDAIVALSYDITFMKKKSFDKIKNMFKAKIK